MHDQPEKQAEAESKIEKIELSRQKRRAYRASLSSDQLQHIREQDKKRQQKRSAVKAQVMSLFHMSNDQLFHPAIRFLILYCCEIMQSSSWLCWLHLNFKLKFY